MSSSNMHFAGDSELPVDEGKQSQNVDTTLSTKDGPTRSVKTTMKEKPPPKVPFGINRYIVVGLYCLYTYVCGCVYWGWDGIENMLFKSGAFSWSCSTFTEERIFNGVRYQSCPDRTLAIQNLYTTAFASHFCFSVVAGTLLDYLGPKICSIIGLGSNILGFVLLGIASESVATYYPACVFIGLAADTIYLPVLSISNLFPKNGSLVISILGSVRSLSFSVPVILSAIYESNASYGSDKFKYFCFGYAVVGCGVAIVIALLLIPMRAFKSPEITTTEITRAIDEEDMVNTMAHNPRRRSTYSGSMTPPIDTPPTVKDSFVETVLVVSQLEDQSTPMPSFGQSLRSPEFLLIVPFFCFCLIRGEFYTKTHSVQLVTSSGGNLIRMFSIMNILSFLPGPVFGQLCDVIGILWGILTYIFLIPDVLALKGISIVFNFIYTSFVLSNLYCYVADTFPPKHFGKLTGIASLCGGLFSLTSIGWAHLSEKGLKHLGSLKCLPADLVMIAFGLFNIGLWLMMYRLKKKGQVVPNSKASS